MAHTRLLIWVTCLVAFSGNLLVESLGVNWGEMASQNLHPDVVIQMLQDNGIKKIKLFDSDHWTVSHFAGKDIEVMLGIPNNQLKDLASDYDNAKEYVKSNVSSHIYDKGVNIKYIGVGNEPFLQAYNGSNMKTTFPALKNIQKALNEAGLGDKIKATIPQNADVYGSGTKGPSEGNFRSDIRDLMVQIVRFLNEHNAPFLVNIYPFLSVHDSPDFPIEFAFFDGRASSVHDKGVDYNNMLDANLDTLVWSLKKAGTPKVKIIIGEIGWPTDGNLHADVKMAQRWYDGFFKKMATKKGTPLYPGPIEYYLFSLTDENLKSVAPGNFERHWGIFTYDGKPKFPMDFTGQGHDKLLVAAKNIKYLESVWCALKSDAKDHQKISQSVGYACEMSDCTSLSYGSTCNGLDEHGNASYAMNMYFQMSNQDVEACNFDGLAHIVKQNLSTGNCLFPVALESGAARSMAELAVTILAGLLVFFVSF